jgi:hypothetical protein
MNYPKMMIFLLMLSICFAPLAAVLGQTLTPPPIQQHQLRGNLTLGGIGRITTSDIGKFESFLKNYTVSYYLRQTDGMVTSVSVSVKVTNIATNNLASKAAKATISFNESISFRAANSALSSVKVASLPITASSYAFLYSIKGLGGTFSKVGSVAMLYF